MARRAARRRRAHASRAPAAILQARVRLACERVPTIFTIGYEKLLPPELVAELEAAGVERVIDVRYRPQSRRPGMSKTRLGELLGDHGIAYEHRRELGTPADLRWLFHPGRIAEAAAPIARTSRSTRRMRSTSSARELEHAPPTALLCLEAEPAGCHRRVITDALRERRDRPDRRRSLDPRTVHGP